MSPSRLREFSSFSVAYIKVVGANGRATKLPSASALSFWRRYGDIILKLQIIGNDHKFKTEELEEHRNGVGKLVLCEEREKHFSGTETSLRLMLENDF